MDATVAEDLLRPHDDTTVSWRDIIINMRAAAVAAATAVSVDSLNNMQRLTFFFVNFPTPVPI